MICFETARLTVRHLYPQDLDALAALCADARAMQYMGDGDTLTREQCAAWIDICQEKYRARGYGTSAIVETHSGAFVGICGVIRAPENDFDEIIYALQPAFWGKGYATEAARAMLAYVFGISTLDTIYATLHAENLASTRMMPKLGMAFVRDEPDPDGSITRVYAVRRAP